MTPLNDVGRAGRGGAMDRALEKARRGEGLDRTEAGWLTALDAAAAACLHEDGSLRRDEVEAHLREAGVDRLLMDEVTSAVMYYDELALGDR
ncbi:MAG: hypothetical protein AAGK21_03930 [Bacteroidota bacterium]